MKSKHLDFIELPKLVVKWRERLVSPWEDNLVRWLFLLEGSKDEEIFETLEEIAMKDPVLNQAMEEWGKSSDDPEVRAIYFARLKATLDEKAAIKEAELRLLDAIKRGKEEGRLSRDKVHNSFPHNLSGNPDKCWVNQTVFLIR